MTVTDQYERDFENVGSARFPGRFDPRLLQNINDVGDGNPGLQKQMRNWVQYWVKYYLHNGHVEQDFNLTNYDLKNIKAVDGNGNAIIFNDDIQMVSSNIDVNGNNIDMGNGNLDDVATIDGGGDAIVIGDNIEIPAAGLTVGTRTLTDSEWSQLTNIDATTISSAQWGYLGNMDQNVATTSSPTFAALTASTSLTANGAYFPDAISSAAYVKFGNGTLYGKLFCEDDDTEGFTIQTPSRMISLHPDCDHLGGEVFNIYRNASYASLSLYQNGSTTSSELGYLGAIVSSTVRPLNTIYAQVIYDDDGSLGSYSHVDDLQLLREVEEWNVREKPISKDFPEIKQKVFDTNTLPWIKAHEGVNEITFDDNTKRYSIPHGGKIGYLLSAMKKILERQDVLVLENEELRKRIETLEKE